MKVLYKIKSGSHLYGLNTPTSDLDYVGVYMEDTFEEFINPFNTVDERDFSIKSKKENGKNDQDAVDEKYFHLKKFIKLCTDNNPNVLEMLFAPVDCIEYVDPLFRLLILYHPEMFVSAKLIDRFIGYAKSQEQKSYTKSSNYLHLEKFKRGLDYMRGMSANVGTIGEMVERNQSGFCDVFKDHYTIIDGLTGDKVLELGGMKFPFGITTKEAISRIEDRFARASHRVEGIFINKYEPKFMSHTIRLLVEGIQLLHNGKIEFPLKGEDKDIIMDIKLGKTLVEDIPCIVSEYKNRLESLELNNTLPKKPDYEAINKAYMKLIVDMYHHEISMISNSIGFNCGG